MSITAKPTPGKTLLSPTDHALVLIDYQSQMAFPPSRSNRKSCATTPR